MPKVADGDTLLNNKVFENTIFIVIGPGGDI